MGRNRTAAAFALFAVAVAALELLSAAQGVHGSTRPSDLFRTTTLLDRIREDPEVFRVLPLHTFLPPNSATNLDIGDLRGYDALSPRAWRQRREEIGRFTATPTVLDVIEPWNLADRGLALDEWNVKYLLLHPQFQFGAAKLNAEKSLDLEEIDSGPDGKLFRNRRVLPRAYLTGAGSVSIRTHLPTKWMFDAESPSPGSLLVANPMYPGWKSYVDGRSVDIRSATGDRIQIPLPAGSHRVELVYRPLSFRIGVATGIVSLGLLALWISMNGKSESLAG